MNAHDQPTADELALCDREPIHLPGSVQPHGALLAVSGPEFRVLQASDNVAAFLGRPAAEAVGRPLTDLLGAEAFDPAREFARVPAAGEPVLVGAVRARGRALNALAHRSDGAVVLELEPTAEGGAAVTALHPIVAGFIARVQGAAEAGELARLAAAEVRRATGFDRALVYRFDPDGTGVVVAEDGTGRLPSYQDHRFPASDIPTQARALYRHNRLRLIPDASYRPARLVPEANPLTGRPLDLSYAALRGVSPVHLEYMRNMGTAASMSVSVLRDGGLWGLVACHHREPWAVPFEARTACDLIAQVFALQVAARERAADAVRAVLTRLLAHMAGAEEFGAGLLARPEDLLGFVAAGGAAVVGADRVGLVGRTPAEGQVRALVAWLFGAVRRDVYHTDWLAGEFPAAAEYAAAASGLLAVSVSERHPTMILWFRPEVVATIQWGGDPRKAVAAGPAGGVPDGARAVGPVGGGRGGRGGGAADGGAGGRAAAGGGAGRPQRRAAAEQPRAGGVLVLGQPRPAGPAAAHRRVRRAAERGRRREADGRRAEARRHDHRVQRVRGQAGR